MHVICWLRGFGGFDLDARKPITVRIHHAVSSQSIAFPYSPFATIAEIKTAACTCFALSSPPTDFVVKVKQANWAAVHLSDVLSFQDVPPPDHFELMLKQKGQGKSKSARTASLNNNYNHLIVTIGDVVETVAGMVAKAEMIGTILEIDGDPCMKMHEIKAKLRGKYSTLFAQDKFGDVLRREFKLQSVQHGGNGVGLENEEMTLSQIRVFHLAEMRVQMKMEQDIDVLLREARATNLLQHESSKTTDENVSKLDRQICNHLSQLQSKISSLQSEESDHSAEKIDDIPKLREKLNATKRYMMEWKEAAEKGGEIIRDMQIAHVHNERQHKGKYMDLNEKINLLTEEIDELKKLLVEEQMMRQQHEKQEQEEELIKYIDVEAKHVSLFDDSDSDEEYSSSSNNNKKKKMTNEGSGAVMVSVGETAIDQVNVRRSASTDAKPLQQQVGSQKLCEHLAELESGDVAVDLACEYCESSGWALREDSALSPSLWGLQFAYKTVDRDCWSRAADHLSSTELSSISDDWCNHELEHLGDVHGMGCFNIGILHMIRKDFVAAERSFSETVNSNGFDVMAYYLRGLSRISQFIGGTKGKGQLAHSDLAKAQALLSSNHNNSMQRLDLLFAGHLKSDLLERLRCDLEFNQAAMHGIRHTTPTHSINSVVRVMRRYDDGNLRIWCLKAQKINNDALIGVKESYVEVCHSIRKTQTPTSNDENPIWNTRCNFPGVFCPSDLIQVTVFCIGVLGTDPVGTLYLPFSTIKQKYTIAPASSSPVAFSHDDNAGGGAEWFELSNPDPNDVGTSGGFGSILLKIEYLPAVLP